MSMQAATRPSLRRHERRLVHLEPKTGRYTHGSFADLPARLQAGDLLVLNDAATLPASLRVTRSNHAMLELRLLRRRGPGRWTAALFGVGSWQTPTEERSPPPRLSIGETLTAADDLHLEVDGISAETPRLVEVRFVEHGPAQLNALYRVGEPVRYSYLDHAEPLASFQTVYASRPWASEMPSAGRALSWELLLELREGGIRLATLTHAAGLSSIDGAQLDSILPLRERFDIPKRTVDLVLETRARRGRIVAVGTTVVRALEGCFRERGQLEAGEGDTNLLLGPGFRPEIVDGILSNMHEPGDSHFELLSVFVSRAQLLSAVESAIARGYRAHEFGDGLLVL